MKTIFSKLLSKKKKVKMEFCQSNLDRHFDEEAMENFEELLSDPNIDIQEFECLSKCKECKHKPYSVVDGVAIEADNTTELLAKLKETVNESS